MADERVYTRLSGLAVKGLLRIVRDRKVYVRDDREGFTVITKDGHRSRSSWPAKRHTERLSA